MLPMWSNNYAAMGAKHAWGKSRLGANEQLFFLKIAELIAGPYRAKTQRSAKC